MIQFDDEDNMTLHNGRKLHFTVFVSVLVPMINENAMKLYMALFQPAKEISDKVGDAKGSPSFEEWMHTMKGMFSLSDKSVVKVKEQWAASDQHNHGMMVSMCLDALAEQCGLDMNGNPMNTTKAVGEEQ
jgi:predicted 3-demethylubiquinone-9 3-methyltransferase (glyoxalase superfamily)